MKPVASLILNRNLPDVTDRLVEHLTRWDADLTDIFVIESGSTPEGRSRHSGFLADWPEAREHGLRFARGFNFGLLELEKVREYDYYFLLCQDVLFPEAPTLAPLLADMETYPRLGILSPCSRDWGEASLIPDGELRCFWYVHLIGWLLRGAFIDLIKNTEHSSHVDYLFDGTNFRGYDADIEVVAKAYVNDYAAGITKHVCFREDSQLTDRMADRMRTDPQDKNRPLMFEEGRRWLRRKYGFNSRWNLVDYSRFLYNRFFELNPSCQKLKV